MSEAISVRQWQEKFQAGDFSVENLYEQRRAGWDGWFCPEAELPRRLKRFAPVIMGIKDPFILDSYYLWFKNNQHPQSGRLYDRVSFERLGDVFDWKGFRIVLNGPDETSKWALYTQRHGYQEPEFQCDSVRQMVAQLNQIGPELAQGVLDPENHLPSKLQAAQGKAPKRKEAER